jgi:hypothetical protein
MKHNLGDFADLPADVTIIDYLRRTTMAKGMNQKKNEKKAPQKTPKEKKAEKQAKKNEK